MNNSFNAYFIQCITNMHVGSGDANYGVVDKLVQRDPVTGFPTIHSSSLKGALREHYEAIWEKDPNKINQVFGKESINNSDSETGEYKFLGADLVSLPVRCNFQQYVLGINKTQIDYLNVKAKLLTNKELFNGVDEANRLLYIANEPAGYNLYAEDIQITTKSAYAALLKGKSDLICFDNKYACFDSESFKSIAKDLPVIARNSIEDGTSQNLWYEEIVPHESIFVTFISTSGSLLTEFETVLKTGIIQIGGNATIGYGLCKFFKITL